MCYNIIPNPTDEQVTNCERLAGNLNIPLKNHIQIRSIPIKLLTDN